MKVELIPLEGIALDGKAIRLGGTKADVTQALGSAGTVRQNSLYYFSNELRVDFDGKGRVEFIGLLGGPDGALQPVIFDVGAFQADPETVAALLKERSPSCGRGQVYDGTFSGTLVPGDGVTAALLLEAGIPVYGESQIGELAGEEEAEDRPAGAPP